ncbi:alanine--tRNA ligase [Anaerocolumna xylanovorans]|uniref:Alanine--tRNA ligase n=1 Tax=Anaerocolumna xylanovorans DSM 12503 TaxID=1121345 RepID=A0A1M7Y3C5_9FIRM|nr:alanine--tRNA ligase [Anaerocolumna xylanovorans]SHO46678.1 alanyl-tRNA synthetase [Anaerocolumna xylanovorans DSM 12503]
MTAQELRRMYAEFFKERGHKEIASASLLPDNDPTVLFTTAGMHPLVPYLLGEKHPLGSKLVNIQKCVRTCDIDEVGDDTHLTFFEMLGNWSLGDYFKEEAISFSFEFLTSKLQIPASKIAVTVFAGDEELPADEEAASIWIKKGLGKNQIFYYGKEENWWGPAGQTGPCGPDTEIFYDMGKEPCSSDCGPACSCGKYVEIWNNVFMQYNKERDGSYHPLPRKNIDTGMGLERILTILDGKDNVYETELFIPVMDRLKFLSQIPYSKDTKGIFRIICEHTRAMTFILGDSKKITPSNTEQGYILRRLIRRTIRLLQKLGIKENILCELSQVILVQYRESYPELKENSRFILEQLNKEYELFQKTLDSGLKKAEQYLSGLKKEETLNGRLAFKLYDTFGFPIEFTMELAKEKGIQIDIQGFYEKLKEHQDKSRKGAEGKFKGGLADSSRQTARLHTATHLLNGALRRILGDSVYQRGSNITSERLRFDFSFERKMTPEELQKVAELVNHAIASNLDVLCEETTPEKARKEGAIGIFDSKYGEKVKVYTIPGYSKEICGGPHAAATGELGHFTIIKEEASSSGVRRIKAILD